MGDGDKKMTLTEEQIKFLEDCEEEFKDRYSDEDEEYVKYKDFERVKPPIVDPWFSKPPFNSNRRNYGQGRRNQNWDRRYNDRGDRVDRHAGRSYQRHRPY